MTNAVKIELLGADGTTYNISGPGMGNQGVELDINPEGLISEAPITQIWQQSAFQEGSTHLGTSIEPIDLVLGFHIYDYTDNYGKYHPWEEVDAKFARAIHHSKPAQIRYTPNSGKPRTLNIIKLKATETQSKHDPHLNQYSHVVATVRAPFPYWRGQTVTYSKRIDTPSADITFTVSNPTDTYMWPKWTVTAPGMWLLPDYNFEQITDTEVTVKKLRQVINTIKLLSGTAPEQLEQHPSVVELTKEPDNRVVRTPFLLDGQDLTIDTYPRNETYVAADNSNIAALMQGVDFMRPIPPHTPETTITAGLIKGTPTNNLIRLTLDHYWKRPY